MVVDMGWSSNGVQLLESNSVIQREVVEEVIEEALGWYKQGSQKLIVSKRSKKFTSVFETLGDKVQVKMNKDGEE